MTEMTDLTSDLLGSGIPFLDYKVYAERVFFPGHQESPLHRDLGVPEQQLRFQTFRKAKSAVSVCDRYHSRSPSVKLLSCSSDETFILSSVLPTCYQCLAPRPVNPNDPLLFLLLHQPDF